MLYKKERVQRVTRYFILARFVSFLPSCGRRRRGGNPPSRVRSAKGRQSVAGSARAHQGAGGARAGAFPSLRPERQERSRMSLMFAERLLRVRCRG